MGAENQIVGVCRFSYPSIGGFRSANRSVERSCEILYDPARMRRRFTYFETICLPSLAAQTDQDFTLVLLIGDTMPLRWRRRLKALAADHPFLQICAIESNGPLQSTRRAFRRGANEGVDFVTGFRIDDDDAVAVDYIARTREAADTLIRIGWADAETPAVVAFQRGLFWDMSGSGNRFATYAESRPLGQASAMITPYDGKANIYRWNHRHLLAHARVWSDPSEVMFLRGLHDDNDSERSLPVTATPLDEGAAMQILRTRFGLAPRRALATIARLHGHDRDRTGDGSGSDTGGDTP